MESRIDLFTKFGGTRPMARDLPACVSTVQGWKKARRVPAKWQPTVLRRGSELGYDVTAEDVTFPFPEDRPADLPRASVEPAHPAAPARGDLGNMAPAR